MPIKPVPWKGRGFGANDAAGHWIRGMKKPAKLLT
jgi:hypothetical protein